MAAHRWLGLLNFALLLLVTELRPLGAQTTNLFAGTFDELFSNGGKVTPIFTRPDAPALPTSIDVSPPSNAVHQHAEYACGQGPQRSSNETGNVGGWRSTWTRSTTRCWRSSF